METAGAPAAPYETAATAEQAVTGSTGKKNKADADKEKLEAIKSLVLKAMGTKDADNAILLQRIEKRFDS